MTLHEPGHFHFNTSSKIASKWVTNLTTGNGRRYIAVPFRQAN
jgi:hypothetical protein